MCTRTGCWVVGERMWLHAAQTTTECVAILIVSTIHLERVSTSDSKTPGVNRAFEF